MHYNLNYFHKTRSVIFGSKEIQRGTIQPPIDTSRSTLTPASPLALIGILPPEATMILLGLGRTKMDPFVDDLRS